MQSRADLPLLLKAAFDASDSASKGAVDRLKVFEEALADEKVRSFLKKNENANVLKNFKTEYEWLLDRLATELGQVSLQLAAQTSEADLRSLITDGPRVAESFTASTKAAASITNKIQSEILFESNFDRRAIIIERWVSIAQRCFANGDIPTFNAIISAILAPVITDLNKREATALAANISTQANDILKHLIVNPETYETFLRNAKFSVRLLSNRQDRVIPFQSPFTVERLLIDAMIDKDQSDMQSMIFKKRLEFMQKAANSNEAKYRELDDQINNAFAKIAGAKDRITMDHTKKLDKLKKEGKEDSEEYRATSKRKAEDEEILVSARQEVKRLSEQSDKIWETFLANEERADPGSRDTIEDQINTDPNIKARAAKIAANQRKLEALSRQLIVMKANLGTVPALDKPTDFQRSILAGERERTEEEIRKQSLLISESTDKKQKPSTVLQDSTFSGIATYSVIPAIANVTRIRQLYETADTMIRKEPLGVLFNQLKQAATGTDAFRLKEYLTTTLEGLEDLLLNKSLLDVVQYLDERMKISINFADPDLNAKAMAIKMALNQMKKIYLDIDANLKEIAKFNIHGQIDPARLPKPIAMVAAPSVGVNRETITKLIEEIEKADTPEKKEKMLSVALRREDVNLFIGQRENQDLKAKIQSIMKEIALAQKGPVTGITNPQTPPLSPSVTPPGTPPVTHAAASPRIPSAMDRNPPPPKTGVAPIAGSPRSLIDELRAKQELRTRKADDMTQSDQISAPSTSVVRKGLDPRARVARSPLTSSGDSQSLTNSSSDISNPPPSPSSSTLPETNPDLSPQSSSAPSSPAIRRGLEPRTRGTGPSPLTNSGDTTPTSKAGLFRAPTTPPSSPATTPTAPTADDKTKITIGGRRTPGGSGK